jgi:hypothetical protein
MKWILHSTGLEVEASTIGRHVTKVMTELNSVSGGNMMHCREVLRQLHKRLDILNKELGLAPLCEEDQENQRKRREEEQQQREYKELKQQLKKSAQCIKVCANISSFLLSPLYYSGKGGR